MLQLLLSSFLMLAFGCKVWGGVVVEKVVNFEGVKYRVVRLPASELKLAWKDSDDKPMRSYDIIQNHYAEKGRRCTLLMNAGIFEPGGVPSGLHIQGGLKQQPLNTSQGRGNFYLKPNGFFCILKGNLNKAVIGVSEQYADLVGSKVRLGLQSGPLLLINDRIHPSFKKGSKSRLKRNGVGIDSDGMVVLVITGEGEIVNLYGFARFFQSMKCKEALYLDGTISRMEVNPERGMKSHGFGAVLVVTEASK